MAQGSRDESTKKHANKDGDDSSTKGIPTIFTPQVKQKRNTCW